MRIKTFGGLAMLLLFSLVSVPTVRPQTKNKAPRESFAPDKERGAKQDERNQNEPPRDGEEWYERAYRMHSSDRYPEAIEAFQRAIDLGYRKGTAMYNIACGYSLLNDKENALLWLQRALDNEFDGRERLRNDSDLDPLRTDARFKKIMDSLPKDDESESTWKKKRQKVDRLERANIDYAKLTQDSSTDGEKWAAVGMRMLLLRDMDRSITALLKAVSYLNEQPSGAMYNLACAYSLKGDRKSGIEWLEKSINAGFDSPQKLSYDPDINNLRSDARFPALEKLSNMLSLSQFNDESDEKIRHKDSGEDYRYNKERWAPAIALYESFLKSEPNNGRAWANLAYARHYSHEHSKAIEAWEHAIALGYSKATSTYNIACAYAMLKQNDLAFEWLDRAFKAGFETNGTLQWDHDLDNLRSDPRFKQLVSSYTYNRKLKMNQEEEEE
ncbi:MAG TPA: tetratricopeptide repeat protein [Pyrinomonadaceae bacterium]|nr:tetratricopeptide repeat protein [Pyrinomonadaceae bacterium]